MEWEPRADEIGVLPVLRVAAIAGAAAALLLVPVVALAGPWLHSVSLDSAVGLVAAATQHLREIVVAFFLGAGLIGARTH